MTKVLIGIQARSTSQRLPGKALKKLYNKPVLSWVINACMDSAQYVSYQSRDSITGTVAILTPIGDEISRFYSSLNVVEGDEFDVLSRYVDAACLYESDYIVRITGDCPFVTSFMITNHIFKAINANLDYVSNVDPLCRTELDGRDIEVISYAALRWLDKHSTKAEDREHVTTKLREVRPPELRRGHFLNRLDVSDIKLSVDTEEDLENAENRMNSFFRKKMLAEKDVGRENVFFN